MPIDGQVALAGGKGYTGGMANLEPLQTTSADTAPGVAPPSGLEFPAALALLGELSEQAIVSAALACASEADFLMRLR